MNLLEMLNNSNELMAEETLPGSSGRGNSASILNEAALVLRGYYGDAINFLFIEKVVVGIFFTGVKLSNGYGGIAYTPPEMIRNASRHILRGNSHPIHGMSAAAVISGKIPSPFADVIRLAAINALSVPFFQNGLYTLEKSYDLSEAEHLFAGRRVCMVGAIVPLLKRFKKMGLREIKVIDRKKESRIEVELACGEFLSPEQAAEALGQCETAVFTGAAIANGTIEHLLSLVPKDAAIAIVGPTAGFVPDPLFRRKVALVGTVMVTDINAALDVIVEGGGAYRLFGRYAKKINILNPIRIEELKLGNCVPFPLPRRIDV